MLQQQRRWLEFFAWVCFLESMHCIDQLLRAIQVDKSEWTAAEWWEAETEYSANITVRL